MIAMQAVPKTVLAARGRQFGNRFRLVKGARLWELNETGSAIWQCCDGSRTVEQILVQIAEEFGCERSESDEPCLRFFAFLLENQLITIEG